MIALYAGTLFVSAALLFLVQPMFARVLLPLFGGSPAVWNTAMVFYQSTLLAGYAYAHFSTTRLGPRRHAALHILLLLLPLAVMPIGVPGGWLPPAAGGQVFSLLGLMLVTVGLPFFVVSTTAPVLQKWFSALPGRATQDPYFLYVASNAGSMLALLAYPALVEPGLRLVQQADLWTWGYRLLLLLVGGCALALRRGVSATTSPLRVGERPSLPSRVRWVLLSFVPSSLMLGVTTYFSTEIAVVPLLWIVPLALYLLTFILAFASRQLIPAALLARTFPILIVVLVLMLSMLATQPVAGIMALHLLVFFVASLLCHTHLAQDRPPASYLTDFYLCLAVGGALGGVFNALVAPLLFDSIAEYPVALVLGCWLALSGGKFGPDARAGSRRGQVIGDWIWPLALGGGTLLAAHVLTRSGHATSVSAQALLFGFSALACYFFSRRPVRFALGVGATLLASVLSPNEEGRALYAERSFFGVHRITEDPARQFHQLVHGTTLHGRQSLDPARRREPLTYYHPTGPIGEVLARYGKTPGARVAVVGLGAGSLASYVQPGQQWSYFEIDPVVVKIARDPRYFTFLQDSPVEIRVVLGDARQTLAKEPDDAFDLLVLDAYTSDAIPVHLATREALALYLRKLAPGGRLALHISNNYLELEPVFANLADDAKLTCLTRYDPANSPGEIIPGKSASLWMVMARQPEELAELKLDRRWREGRRDPKQRIWTDDYSNLLGVLRWQ
jgi:SAM-dependent methyltransferase